MEYNAQLNLRVGDGLRCAWGTVRVVTKVTRSTIEYMHPSPELGLQHRSVGTIETLLRTGQFVKVWQCPPYLALPVGI